MKRKDEKQAHMMTCRRCRIKKPDESFAFRKDEGTYRRTCRACCAKRRREKKAEANKRNYRTVKRFNGEARQPDGSIPITEFRRDMSVLFDQEWSGIVTNQYLQYDVTIRKRVLSPENGLG